MAAGMTWVREWLRVDVVTTWAIGQGYGSGCGNGWGVMW